MADLSLNLDFSSAPSRSKPGQESHKHKTFMKKRRFLERCGFLKQKQLPQKLPERKQPGNPRDQSNKQTDYKKGGHDRTQGQTNNTLHQKGTPNKSSRTVSTTSQPGTLKVSINCAPIQPLPPRDNKHTATGAPQNPTKPIVSQKSLVSEYESCLPSGGFLPSHKVVAIDCEMVGTGPKGAVSSLARCSIVGYDGDVLYDKYIKPTTPIVNYRTKWSGIRREHMIKAIPFKVAQKEILKILQGKIVIGHAIQNDFKAIQYFHPKEMTRDTSKIPLLNRKAGFPETETVSLKRLSKQVLKTDIQIGTQGHSSVEDAKSTMLLYKAVEMEYEIQLAEAKHK